MPGAAFEPRMLADDDTDAAVATDAADGVAAPSEPPPPRRPATAHAERPATASAAGRPASASAAGRRAPQRIEVLEVARRARPCACACITARSASLLRPG